MKTFADILPILLSSLFSSVTDDGDITYDQMTYDDTNDIITFYTVDDEGLEWELYFNTNSPIIVSGEVVTAHDSTGEPVTLRFFKSVPIKFLEDQ